MAGKELKATEKTILKHSREGVIEQNLADGSARKVSKKAEEAVLKVPTVDDERFDKLKAAGLVVVDLKKPEYQKLKIDKPPRIIKHEVWHYSDYIPYIKARYVDIKPVNRRKPYDIEISIHAALVKRATALTIQKAIAD